MRYLVSISFLVATLTSSAAFARDTPIRVAVSPFVYLTTSAPADGGVAVVRGIEEWVAGDATDFSLASIGQMRARVTSVSTYGNAVAIAKVQQNTGIKSYRELDPASAVENLAAARDLYFRADHQFIAPREVSEALLFYALALLDASSGNPSQPLDVMKEMVLIDPQREVSVGAFPDEVVGFYESARLELERDVREGGPGETFPRRVAELAAERQDGTVTTPTDYVLVGNVLPAANGAVELVVWVYDVAQEQFQQNAAITVTSPNAARLQQAANRLASRLMTCFIEAPPAAETPLPGSSGSSPFALQLNLAYASFYNFPNVGAQAVEPFAHLGAGIGGALFLTREFALVAVFQFLASTSEYSKLVEPGFTTLRSFAGGEIGIGFKRVRFSLGTLLEGAAISRITTCPGTDVQDRRFCREPVVLPSRFLFGINARPRVSYQILDPLQVFVGASTSFYFLPQDTNSLNFLTAGEAGLQYRF